MDNIMKKDMHYYCIFSLARAAGIDPIRSKTIAYSSQYVDDSIFKDIKTHKDGGKLVSEATAHHFYNISNMNKNDQREIWVPFHFLPGAEGISLSEKLICKKNSKLASAVLKKGITTALSNVPYGLHAFGISLHTFADTFAHYGFSGVSSRRNRVKGSSIKILSKNSSELNLIKNKTNKFFKKYGEQGGKVENFRSKKSYKNKYLKAPLKKIYNIIANEGAELASGALGHGAVSTHPDLPFLKWSYEYEYKSLMQNGVILRNNFDDYLEACEHIFNSLVQYSKLHNIDNKSIPEFYDIKTSIKNILSIVGKKIDRINGWKKSYNNGEFTGIIGEEIPNYDRSIWQSQKDNFGKLYSSNLISSSNIYNFYTAASFHKQYVIKSLLPKYGIIIY